MMSRRTLLRASGAAAATAALPTTALAQTPAWPAKPIRAIVPFTPGSTTDVIGRIVAEAISPALGQPIVIENRSGAGGTIGTAVVAKSDPDGYTILLNASAHSASPAAFPDAPYNARTDIAGVAVFGVVPNVIVVATDSGIKSLKDLVTAGQKRELTYASAGIGSATHWAAERWRLSAGLKGTHVPFKGGPEGLADVAAGRVDFMAIGSTSALPFIKGGRLIGLAVTTRQRSALFPELPTTIEAGFPDSDYTFWNGLLVPAKTPPAIVNRLHGEVMKAIKTPAVAERLVKQGLEPLSLSPGEFDALIAKEIVANLAIVKAAGLKFN
jgi:tripartite-type tricarboxylate transporter receptor subunit TctC